MRLSKKSFAALQRLLRHPEYIVQQDTWSHLNSLTVRTARIVATIQRERSPYAHPTEHPLLFWLENGFEVTCAPSYEITLATFTKLLPFLAPLYHYRAPYLESCFYILKPTKKGPGS